MIEETRQLLSPDVVVRANDKELRISDPDNYTQEDWIRDFNALRTAEQVLNWRKGDLLAFARAKWGRAFVRSFGLSIYELKLLSTSMLFPPDLRHESLSYTHHLTVFESGIRKTRDAVQWINRTAKEEWSILELRVKIRKSMNAELEDLSVRPCMKREYLCFQEATTFAARHPVNDQPLDFLLQMKQRLGPLVEYHAQISATIQTMNEEL